MNARAFAITACLLATVGCGTASSGRRTTRQEETTSSRIFKRLGITPPTSAKIEYARYQSGMDDNAQLIIVLKASDWPTLLEQVNSLAARPIAFSAANNLLLGRDEPHWKPISTPGLQAGQAQLAKAEALNVGFAPLAPDKVRIFFFWHQT